MQALVRFNPRQQLPPPDIVAHRLGDADHSPRELAANFGAAGRGELDRAEQLAGFTDGGGACGFDDHAIGLGNVDWNAGLPFRVGVFPDVAFAFHERDDFEIEAVRLDHGSLAIEPICDRLELEHVHLAIEAVEGHGQIDQFGIERLAVPRWEHAELRRHAILEDGHFQSKIAVAQHPPIMRSLFRLSCCAMFSLSGLLGSAAASSEGQSRQQGRKDLDFRGTGHCSVSPPAETSKRPESRSISVCRSRHWLAAAIHSFCASTMASAAS